MQELETMNHIHLSVFVFRYFPFKIERLMLNYSLGAYRCLPYLQISPAKKQKWLFHKGSFPYETTTFIDLYYGI